jgi:hypothetical protein
MARFDRAQTEAARRASTSLASDSRRSAAPWRAGHSVGVQITTAAEELQFVSWSRKAALETLSAAREEFGPAQEAYVRDLGSALGDFEARRSAEAVNAAAATLFELADAQPSAFGILSRIEFKSLTDPFELSP